MEDNHPNFFQKERQRIEDILDTIETLERDEATTLESYREKFVDLNLQELKNNYPTVFQKYQEAFKKIAKRK